MNRWVGGWVGGWKERYLVVLDGVVGNLEQGLDRDGEEEGGNVVKLGLLGEGGWVGGWLGSRKVEENEAVRMGCWTV